MADKLSNASDADLVNIAQQFRTVVNANPVAYGMSAAQITDLTFNIQTFDTDLTAHVSAQSSARNARETKDASRAALEQTLRTYARIAKAVPGISEAQLAAVGLPFGDSSNAPASATRPAGRVDTSERLRHSIHFADEATPNNKKKPSGVVGCEIFMKIDGAPPTDEKECTFLTLDTQTPHIAEFEGDQAGKMAHYLLRWRTKDGSGAWGDTLSATITG